MGEYGALRKKQLKSPDSMTNEEQQRMKALEAECERLLCNRCARALKNGRWHRSKSNIPVKCICFQHN
jgi:hypothetical protein